MNEQSGSDWKDEDLFRVINNAYYHILMKEIILKQLYLDIIS